MTPDAADSLARELVALHEAAREVPAFSERYPDLSPEDGYGAARRLHAHRVAQGWTPVGRKIGFTNRSIWPRYGVFEPMWGFVYDRTVRFAEGRPVTLPLAGLAQPRIEPEILFRLKVPPPRSRDPAELLAAIEWIAHSIEIVQCHHPGWKIRIADCTADNGLHGRLIVGTPVPVSELAGLAAKLPALEVTLSKSGQEIDRGIGANVLDSPLHALAFLIEVLTKQPEAPALAAGEIISTGTLTDAHPVARGERWSTTLRGLPLDGLNVAFA